MDQGAPNFIYQLTKEETNKIINSVNLNLDDIYPNLPFEVISTGLPYLIVPLVKGIERASIYNKDFESLLNSINAKFVYLLDIPTLEGRTWDNIGKVEDIATGSAVGPAAAYLHKHKLINEKEIIINQGRFLNRPSQIRISIEDNKKEILSLKVSGDVAIFAHGEMVQGAVCK